MTEVKMPSCGRIVHYFPNSQNRRESSNGAEFVPFLVIQNFNNLLINGQVFPMIEDGNSNLKWSIHHKSESIVGDPYWDWPEIK